MTRIKKILSILLAFSLMACIIPIETFTVSAATYSGECGDNLAWSFNSETGVLNITGSGKMTNYTSSSSTPWYSYTESITKITIGSSVTTIGNYAFYKCTAVTSVTLGSNVSSIGSYAFYGCNSLTTVSIPSSVTQIGAYSFYNCTGISSVTIPNNVISIGGSAFSGCTELTSITIPKSVTSIGNSAFSGCIGLTKINYNAKSVTGFTSSSNIFYNAGTNGDGINVVFGDGIENIPSYLFYATSYFTFLQSSPKITRVTIPCSVTNIGNFAFYNCNTLKNVYFLGTFEQWNKVSIGSDNECLENAALNSSGDCIWEIDGTELIISGNGAMADYKKTLLNKTSAPWGTSITTVTISNGVTGIGNFAFSGCSKLSSVTIPDSVTRIGSSAFEDCTRLAKINYNAKSVANLTSSSEVFNNAGTGGNGIEVIFGDSVEKIPAYLFYTKETTSIIWSTQQKLLKLTSVTIADSVTSIGEYAFDSSADSIEINYKGSESAWNKISKGSNAIPSIATVYYYNCAVSGHIYDNDCDAFCNICGEERAITHIYDNACDTNCNICGYERTVTHNYVWSSNNMLHWRECSFCHSIGSIRDIAEHIYDNDCDASCNICGFIRTVEPHEYDNDCDTICNICGEVRTIIHAYRTVWSNDGTYHWHECSVCGDKTDFEEHIYNNDCDTNCNVCGYKRTVGEHIYDNSCDIDCNICGQTRTVTHDYQTVWSSNENEHWHECSVCHDRTDIEKHIFDDDFDVTCNICGKVCMSLSPIQSIEISDISIMENTNGWEDDGFFYYSIWPEYSVTLKNGDIINSNGSSVQINGEWYSLDMDTYIQYDEHWTVGNTYKVTGSLLGVNSTFNVTITESLIKSISIDDITVDVFDGSYSSYWDENNICYPYYHYYFGPHFFVTLSDGRVIESEYGSVEIDGNYFSLSLDDKQYETAWDFGNSYKITGSLMGKSDTFTVTVADNPIESVEIEDITVYESIDGYYNGWDSEKFFYYNINPSYKITMKDGKVYYCEKNRVLIGGKEYYISAYCPETNVQNPQNHFQTGNTYKMTGYVLGFSDTFSVTVKENPITKISIKEYPKNEYLDGEVFDLYGATLRFSYNDGTYEDVNIKEHSNPLSQNHIYLKKFNAWFDYCDYIDYDEEIAKIELLNKTITMDVFIFPNLAEVTVLSENEYKQLVITVYNSDGSTYDMTVNYLYAGAGNDNPYSESGIMFTDKGNFGYGYEEDSNGRCRFNVQTYTNRMPNLQWMQIRKHIEYDSAIISELFTKEKFYYGVITEENIDKIIAFSAYRCYCQEEQISGDAVRAMVYDVFGKEIDLSLSDKYDAQTDIYILDSFGYEISILNYKIENIDGVWKAVAECLNTANNQYSTVFYEFDNDFKIVYFGIGESGKSIIGDASGDGKVDAQDLIILRKALLTDSKYSEVLDANGDGVVDIRDLVRMKKHLADNNVPLGKQESSTQTEQPVTEPASIPDNKQIA